MIVQISLDLGIVLSVISITYYTPILEPFLREQVSTLGWSGLGCMLAHNGSNNRHEYSNMLIAKINNYSMDTGKYQESVWPVFARVLQARVYEVFISYVLGICSSRTWDCRKHPMLPGGGEGSNNPTQ